MAALNAPSPAVAPPARPAPAGATTSRVDKGPALNLGATPIEVRPDGKRVYEGTATYGDILKPYPELDPPRVEFAPADEVMSPEAIASMIGAIFTAGPRRRGWDGTITLPADHAPDLFTAETAVDNVEGAVLAAWRLDAPGKPPALRVRVIAYTKPVQDLIESGIVELSPGFKCKEDWTPGEFNGQKYDLVQRHIRFDHLNLVDRARGRTPDGIGARLDRDPAVASYSRRETAAMDDDNQTPLPDAATTATPSAAPGDVARKDAALSDEDMALLRQMSPEAQALLMPVVEGAPVAAEVVPVAAVEDAAAGGVAEQPAGTVKQADILAKLEEVLSLINATSATPAPTPGKKDAAPMTRATTPQPNIDAAAVLETARKDAAAAATSQYNADAQFVAMVKKDHAEVVTTTDAAATMLRVIGEHLPVLADDAKALVTAGRLDSLTLYYKQAEQIRRDSIMRAQEDVLGDVFGGHNVEAAPVAQALSYRAPKARA